MCRIDTVVLMDLVFWMCLHDSVYRHSTDLSDWLAVQLGLHGLAFSVSVFMPVSRVFYRSFTGKNVWQVGSQSGTGQLHHLVYN